MNTAVTPDAVSDSLATRKQLALDHALINAFLENVPEIVYFKDRESRFIAVSKSKAARHGCTDRAELIGKTDADLFSEGFAFYTRSDEETIMRTGVPSLNKVERIVWPDGHVTWARSSKMPLYNDRKRILGTFGITEDITAAKEMEEKLEQANKELMDASRLAGMAEVATGVLHNVGNVLNSLNVSATVITSGLRKFKTDSLAKICSMLDEHAGDLGAFLTSDPKGKLVPEFLKSLSLHASEERERLLHEIMSLQQNIDHIKEIVSMQQMYATMAGVLEPLEASTLMEDALRMNKSALERHNVTVVRDFQTVPHVLVERGKVLQILINLIRNAKYAMDEGGGSKKILTLRIQTGPDRTVHVAVVDNGIGIPPENLERIFNHGFTTRQHGHGFGLHSSVLAAQEMNGSLAVQSDGLGKGATFLLELPVADTVVVPGASEEAGADGDQI